MQNTTSGTGLAFEFAWLQSQGRRARQEDFCASLPDVPAMGDAEGRVLIALADGMGGHVSGQIASRTVCDSFIGSFRSATGNTGTRLAHALEDCNDALARAIDVDPKLAGMGSTLVAAHADSNGVKWVSVGDSTLMLYRDGILQRLNADHSHGAILDQQAAAGIISEEIAKGDVRRRALHSAVTGQPIPLKDIELVGEPLLPGDWVIVASDGLLTLGGDELATLIHDHAQDPPATLVAALISAVEAEQEPNQDNTTVAALRVVESTSRGIETDEERAPDAETVAQSEVLSTTRILPRHTAKDENAASIAGTAGGSSTRMIAMAVAAAALALAAWALLR
ncbi:MAG: SpoIIE family protein phosphatase [Hyphomicrobiaceae bacterium]|nr:SpoIIE family protein phosphatase [Hyphomicrobiaceae bacterium]